MSLAFGSPEANKIAERNKVFSKCEEIECARCQGAGTIYTRKACGCCGHETEKEVTCPHCCGEGRVLESPDGQVYSLFAVRV